MKRFSLQDFLLSFYSAQLRKKTIIPSIPMIHEGKNWKNHKKGSQMGGKSTEQKKTRKCIRHSAKISHGAKFRASAKLLYFPGFSTILSFWFLICNAEFEFYMLGWLDKFGINSLKKLQN